MHANANVCGRVPPQSPPPSLLPLPSLPSLPFHLPLLPPSSPPCLSLPPPPPFPPPPSSLFSPPHFASPPSVPNAAFLLFPPPHLHPPSLPSLFLSLRLCPRVSWSPHLLLLRPLSPSPPLSPPSPPCLPTPHPSPPFALASITGDFPDASDSRFALLVFRGRCGGAASVDSSRPAVAFTGSCRL